MNVPDSFKAYVEAVLRQVRWKKAHFAISRELEAHLCDTRDCLLSAGYEEDEAVKEAIRQTGSPVEIGVQLDSVHRPRPYWPAIILTLTLVLAGVLVRAFLTYGVSPQLALSALSAIIGIALMTSAYFIDYTLLGKHACLVSLAIYLAAPLMCFVPGQPNIFGSCARYSVLLYPTAFALMLYALRGRKVPGAAAALAYALLLCLSGHIMLPFTGFLITAPACFIMMLAAAQRDLFLTGRRTSVIYAVCAAVLCIVFIWTSGFAGGDLAGRLSAVTGFTGGESAVLGADEIRRLIDSSVFIGSAGQAEYSAAVSGWKMDMGYLLTGMICRFGWVSFLAVMTVYGAFFFFFCKACMKQRSVLGALLSYSVVISIALQTMCYILSNLGLAELAAISLPLLSYGNAATIINLALIGLALSVFRTGSLYNYSEVIAKI